MWFFETVETACFMLVKHNSFFGKLKAEELMQEVDGFSILTESGRMRCDAVATEIPAIEDQGS